MVHLPLQCVLWGCLLTAVHLEPPTACRENQYLENGQCCNLCQPGERLVNDCTALTDTECLPCGKDEFLDTWNREPRCHQHRYCDPNLRLRVQTKGTSKTDTTCTCVEGQYCTSSVCERCAPHSLCLPGFGVKQIATGDSDTICEPCLDGFFSNVSSASEKCRPWTSCEARGLQEMQAGTNTTDARCDSGNRWRLLLVIPIILSTLLATSLVLVLSRKMKKSKNMVDRQVPEETVFVDFPGPNPAAPVQETLHGCQPVTQEDGKESRVSVQERQ
ncbi:tumor necrosis factor receptor superfamily member 5 isoform X2 [Tupaia chinensis]|uniref:tumor necrosis factor receptor superfamily member 5 isoform X2 n=1 Tax=Tupaia chinensis TaxID=246437 RepID=UPI0003C8EA3C|nr:tumor necrosis factor receptor superfamily member 5 isoform X2 [Tupaia chinensis]